jgi:uncharacterized protein YjbI with pentapeptide repeats
MLFSGKIVSRTFLKHYCGNGNFSHGESTVMRRILVCVCIVGMIVCGALLTTTAPALAASSDCTARGFEADLSGCDLRGVDLTDAILTRADLSDANLTGVNLTGANLRNAYLLRTNFTGADLTGADLTGSNAYFINFTNAILTNAILASINIPQGTLTNVRSGGVTGTPQELPYGWQITSGYLIGPKANLSDVDLTGVDLTGVNLSGANLTDAMCTGTNFTGANLTRANLA